LTSRVNSKTGWFDITRVRPSLFLYFFLVNSKNIKLIYKYLASHIFYIAYIFMKCFFNFFLWDNYIYNLHSYEIFLNFSMYDSYIYNIYLYKMFLNIFMWDSYIYIVSIHMKYFLIFFMWDNYIYSVHPHELFFIFLWDICEFFLIFTH